MPEESEQPIGLWGKFVALFLGVPPVAFRGDAYHQDVDQDVPSERQPPR